MEIIRTVKELRRRLDAARALGRTVGLVPTMGALHDGHLSLVNRATSENDITVVSVFVNPTQFNNAHDLATYPRTEEADARRLTEAGVTYAFMPSVEEMYPQPDERVFDLGSVAQVMEGPRRPGHFNGVAQVVSKLFDIVTPDRAYFGEKDFQQIAVLRRMLEITKQPVRIVPCPIVREEDGLALSSRNVRLNEHQRAIAPQIHAALEGSVAEARNKSVDAVKQQVIDQINAIPGMEVEYYDIVDPITMQPVTDWPKNGAQGCVTVNVGEVRLIDNIHYY